MGFRKKESWLRTSRVRISPSWGRRGLEMVSASGISDLGLVGETRGVDFEAEVEDRLRLERSIFLLKRKCSNKGFRPSKR